MTSSLETPLASTVAKENIGFLSDNLFFSFIADSYRVSSSCKIKIQPKFHVLELFSQPKRGDFAYFFQLPTSILY